MTADLQIRELQQIVLEKDDLLKVLTERLELAAEQLDRLRRQGSMLEPSHHVAQAPKSPQLDSPGVLEDLKQMLADWQDLQTRDWFGSLEEKLDGVHGLVSHLQSMSVRSPIEEKQSTPSVAEILAKYQAGDNSNAEGAVPDAAELEQIRDCDAPATELVLPEPPPSMDIERGSTEELREGLRQREDYISRLRDYLLAYDALTSTPIEGIDLDSLSAEQTAAMEAWEAKVRKDLRQTQIQLWVERAQLSREQMQLQQKVHHLETETRRLGLTNPKDGPGSGTAATGADSPKGKNWLGLFGGK